METKQFLEKAQTNNMISYYYKFSRYIIFDDKG